jgi:neutral trehalase
MVRWTEYFFKCRDVDKDGIWENRNPGETGWEDAPYFSVGFPLASPDMNAYLALQLEAQARLGRLIGVDEAVCAGYEKRATELVHKIIAAFWDGSRWVAFNSETKATAYTKSLPLFAALILGKRLPQEIIDKSIDYIFKDGKFLTPYGLASESLDSDDFFHGWSRGCVNTPAQLIFCLALEACGRPELAKEVAVRYLDALNKTGLYHMHNALTGQPEKLLVGNIAGSEKYLFWSAWTASCYLFLAERYGV